MRFVWGGCWDLISNCLGQTCNERLDASLRSNRRLHSTEKHRGESSQKSVYLLLQCYSLYSQQASMKAKTHSLSFPHPVPPRTPDMMTPTQLKESPGIPFIPCNPGRFIIISCSINLRIIRSKLPPLLLNKIPAAQDLATLRTSTPSTQSCEICLTMNTIRWYFTKLHN